MSRNWIRSIGNAFGKGLTGRQLRAARKKLPQLAALESRQLLAAPTIVPGANTTFFISENIGVNGPVNGTGTSANSQSYFDPVTGASSGNTSQGQYVGSIATTTNDAVGAITGFDISGFGSTSPFSVAQNAGNPNLVDIFVNNWEAMNFENGGSFSVTFNIRDSGTGSGPENGTGTFTVSVVGDRNDIPYITRTGNPNEARFVQEFTVDENAVAGTVLTGISGVNANGRVASETALGHATNDPVGSVNPHNPLDFFSNSRGDLLTAGQDDGVELPANNVLSYDILDASSLTIADGGGGANEIQYVTKDFALPREGDFVSGAFLLSFSSDLPMQTVTQGVAGTTSEVQQIDFGAPPPFGFYTLTFRDTAVPQTSQTTRRISYTATAAQVQAELQALTNLGANNVLVTSIVNVAQTTAGGVGINEVQTLTLTSPPKSGQFFLSFNGQLTAGISSTATAGQVQAALEALTTIGAGNVSVTGSPGGPYVVTFQGALAQQNVTALQSVGGYTITFAGSLSTSNQNQLEMTSFSGQMTYSLASNQIEPILRAMATVGPTGNTNATVTKTVENATEAATITQTIRSAAVSQTTQGGGGADEVQLVAVNAGPGNFRLTFGGQTTISLSAAASAATVQQELEALSTIGVGNVAVAGGGGLYIVTFVGALGNADQPLLQANETQLVSVANTGLNTFRLALGTNVTATLPRTATAAQVQAALEALPSIGAGNLSVSSPGVGQFEITFVGTLASTDVATLTAPNGVRVFDTTDTDNPGFRLQYLGFSTTLLPRNATAAQVQQALERTASIGTGRVTVTSTIPGIYNISVDPALLIANAFNPLNSVTANDGWRVNFQGALANRNLSQIQVINQSDMFSISNDRPTLGRLTVSATAPRYLIGFQGDGSNGLNSGYEFIRQVFGTSSDQILVPIRVFDNSNYDVLNDRNSPSISSLTYDEYVVVTINDVSEAAPVIQDEAFTISENSPNGTVVGRINDAPNVVNVVTTPAGVGTNEVQTITATTTAPFPAGTFALRFNGQQTTRLRYDATALEVENALRALSSIGPTGVAVGRTTTVNSTSWTVTFTGPLAATDVPLIEVVNGITDPESPPQIFAYQIVGGNTNNAFAINASTGEITVNNAAQLDFETGPTYRLLVQVRDVNPFAPSTSTLSTITAVDINLTDFNEPTRIADGQQFSVEEGSPFGTLIGAVSASDDDRSNATLIYTITNGNTLDVNGNPTFAINATTGVISVNSNLLLDSVTNPFFDLEVRVTDNHIPLSSTAVNVIRINVVDVNQSPPILNDVTFTISENRPNNFLVGTLQGVTTETNQTITYSIINSIPNAAPFSLNPTTGQIRVNNPPGVDFEGNSQFQILVRASDSGTPSLFDTALVTIFITDLNEQIDIAPQNFSIAENSPSGTVVGTVATTDPDDNDGIVQGRTFQIVSGNTNNAFTINASTGELSVLTPSALNFEASTTFNLVVQVNDVGLAPSTADIDIMTISVTNANDPPVLDDQTLPPLNEHRLAGTVVGTVVATDQDVPAQAFTFSIVGGNTGDAFVINAATGQISVNNPGAIDFAQSPVFSLTVQVTDNGSPARSDTGIVTINLIDGNPPIINDQTIQFNENTFTTPLAIGDVVGNLNRTGGTGPFNFSITSGNTGNAFVVNSSGQLVVNNPAALDFETNPTFSLAVFVSDSSSPQLADNAIITVNLLNVDENIAPVVGNFTFSVAENSGNGTTVGTVTATDPNAGQTLGFAITAGDPQGVFQISATTGQITVANAALLNFEAAQQFVLTVTVTDNGVPVLSSASTVTINVGNVNDPPTIANQTFSVAENSPAATVVGTVVASDQDVPTQTLSYDIIAGNTGGAFQINASTGQITVANSTPVDFEVNPVFNLTVEVTDNGSPAQSSTATVTINLTDVNDAPVIAAQSFSIAENPLLNAVVGTVAASDPDVPAQTLTFSITGGNTSNAFTINGATGQITVTNPAAVDFETNPVFNLTVQVIDNGSPARSSSATVTINVTNTNDTPVVNNQTFSVAENAPGSTVVGTVVASDADVPAQQLTYEITAGNTGGAFAINSTTGQITVVNSVPLNFEVNPVFSLTVQVTDNGSPNLSDTATITINVNNINDFPVVNNQTFSIAENSPVNTLIATIVGSDEDVGQTLNWVIVSGNTGNTFSLNSSTGQLRVANPLNLDFETNPQFSLVVRATDSGQPALSATATITINVTNVNDAPTLANRTFSIAENTANGTLLGTLAGVDQDAGQTLSYLITGGNVGGAFSVNSATGQLTVANSAALDFETNPSFALTVQVTDSGNPALSGTGLITVNLTNVNELPVITDQSFTLAENSPVATLVGTVTASDPDGAGPALSIVGGNVGGAFTINASTGVLTVANAAAVNFEQTPVFQLRVRATDAVNPNIFTEATVTVNLTNVNEPPVVDDQTFSVSENAANGTLVGTVAFVDPDANQTRSVTIVSGNAAGVFAIDSATGQITVADRTQLDFETTATYSLLVQVTDSATPALSDQATITINVLDVNEAPVIQPESFFIAENSPVGTSVGTVTAIDPDGTFNTRYSIVANNVLNTFAINQTTGEITVANLPGLNFERANIFILTVRASDGANPALFTQAAVRIEITDVNEAPSIIPASFNVTENSSVGTEVGFVPYFEPDANQRHSFAILSGNSNGAFAINSATGRITVANPAAVNFEGQRTFTLQVQVTDNGTPTPLSGVGPITINVLDVNEPPVITPPPTFTVPENSPLGTNVGTVQANDPDGGQPPVFSIVANNVGNAFAINATTGQITVLTPSALDFERADTFILRVRARDAANPAVFTETDVTIRVTNANEAPSILPNQSFTLAENTAGGTVLGLVNWFEPDAGQRHTFTIVGGNPGGAFAIHPQWGQLTVANPAALDFETNPVFDLQIQIADNGVPPLSSVGVVRINLTNVNEAPNLLPQTFSIAENSANGSVVGTVVGGDPDAGQQSVFSIVSQTPSAAFSINASTGQLRVSNSALLDFETNPQFRVTVRVTDPVNSALFQEAVMTINLTNVNEPPVVPSQTFSVAENTANGTAVGQVSFSNPELGQTVRFAIEGGNTNGAFAIDQATGRITVANRAALDFEQIKTFNLQVRATDNGSPAASSVATVTINVLNANEPPVIDDQTFRINENSAVGTTVGGLVWFDPDAGTFFPTFTIVSGNETGAFAINQTTGRITVANRSALNFETTPTFRLNVRLTDNGTPSLSDTAVITVNLNDVNEEPVVNDQSFSLRINSAVGTVVGNVAASDPDQGQRLNFGITGGNTNNAFRIDPTTGRITVNNASAVTRATTYRLVVVVSDSGNPSLTDSAIITITVA
jgi:VCBS repeat-containing protein